MSIIIVTTYASTNCGSYWQARQLKTYFEENGCNVYFLKIQNLAWNQYFREALKSKLYKEAGFLLIGKVRFIPWLTKLRKKRKAGKEDILVFGSDEIWNIRRKIFCQDLLWGINMPQKKFAYAVSANNAECDDFRNNCYFTNGIRDFKRIAVRDEHTKSVIREFSNREISIVCDPTMLFEKEVYESYVVDVSIINRPFMLIYAVGDQAAWTIRDIKIFARANGLLIVSLGWYKAWADINICPHPLKFIKCFLDADYIITNTFHGCCFAINLNKEFASIAGRNNQVRKKVKGILKQFDLEKRVIKSDYDIFGIFEEKMDYTQVNVFLSELRCRSRMYLKEIISNVGV